MSPKQSFRARTRQRLLVLGCGVALGLVASVSTSAAQPSSDQGGGNSHTRIREVQVTNDQTRDNGQPTVAVNPRNPRNQVFISTNHIPGPMTTEKYHCFVAHSQDAGATWSEVAWPYGDRAMCGDPNLVVDSRGIFYVAFNRLGCAPGEPPGGIGGCNDVPNHLAVSRSLDGGRTWSEPVDTPLGVAVTPRLRIDTATDRIYAVGQTLPDGKMAITTSSDRGLTWTQQGVLPEQPFGNQIAVDHGILATATALKIVDGTQVVPSEVTFSTSRDGGRTYTSSPLTDGKGRTVAPPSGSSVPVPGQDASDPIPWISADPTHKGRFALMIPRDDKLEVYTTKDAGRSWRGPALVSAPGAVKPWIEYSPTGLLGVMWRTTAVNVYATVSFNDGKSFGAPLKVNRTSHPGVQAEGDEWSRISFDRTYAYITWSDARGGAGTLDGVVSRVPLSEFHRR